MRPPLFFLVLWAALALPAHSIPNQVGGFLARIDSPLNGTDLTDVLLDERVWAGTKELPGNWQEEAPVGSVRGSFLAARPHFLGLPALMVQARHRAGALDSLAITFADAGSYFGYLNETLPPGLSKREQQDELRRRLASRQEEFAKMFAETEASLGEALQELADKRPKSNQVGRTRALRAEVTDYRKGDLLLRLIVGGGRLIRLIVVPEERASRVWLDAERSELSALELERLYREHVRKSANGDLQIDDIPIVPQGYKPYCGLNTLTMAARYFGLHLDEDWLAVAGRFQNTGSAAGSQIPRLYSAVAKEAGLDLRRTTGFTLDEARSSLDRGLPVVVWRRYSHQRNQVHSEQSAKALRDPEYVLPAADQATREAWPDESAPLHASVIVGYNARRQEILFVESWAGMKSSRRMRAEELAATAYLSFFFKP